MSKGGNVFRPLENILNIVVSGKDEIKIEIDSGLSKIQNFLNVHFSVSCCFTSTFYMSCYFMSRITYEGVLLHIVV